MPDDTSSVTPTKGAFRLRNTLGGKVEPFTPRRPDEVRMYTCGLTVYARGHIGNFRTFVVLDTLRRFLRFKGYRVRQVMNFTDVDDKTIRGAAEAGEPLRAYTTRFIEDFFADADALGIERAEHYPRATDPEYITAMVRLVETLLEKGAAYESAGSIYFRVAGFPGYGRLSGAAASDRQAGARVDSDEYDKEDAYDFVLWKAAKPGEPQWEAPFGAGRPGWHLECSAMGLELLGPDFDLHCGGVDLGLPAPRERDRPERSRDGGPVRAPLVPLRAPAGRGPEDGQVVRQPVHCPRAARRRVLPGGHPPPADERPLPPATELHEGRPPPGGSRHREGERFPPTLRRGRRRRGSGQRRLRRPFPR